jgi:subtilisin family serine protease
MNHVRRIRRLSLSFLAAAALLAATSIDTSNLAAARPDPPPEDGSTAIALVAERLRADPATLTIVNQASTSLDDGELGLTSAKVMDRDGQVHGVTFDAGGKEVDLDALVAESRARHRERFGAVHPALEAALADAPDEPRPVLIWLAGAPPSDLDVRPDASGDPLDSGEIDEILAGVDARRLEAVAPLVEALLPDVLPWDKGALGLAPTPAIAATLDARAVAELARDERIDTIYDAPAMADELEIAKQTTAVSRVHGTGLSGKGVRVAVIEVNARVEQNSLLLRPVLQDPQNVCANVTPHVTNVTSVIAGRRVNVFGTLYGDDGVGFGADVRVGGTCNGVTAQLQTAATRAADWGARVLNLSFGRDDFSVVGANDRFYDEMVHNRWRTVVPAAGNEAGGCGSGSGRVTSPATGYNVTTVGNFDDAGTAQWGDDTMGGCSSFVDPISRNGDREKPELAAPGTNVTMVDPGPANQRVASGTSFAAPHVSGTAALLIEKNGRLAVWPEIVRAVLMASAAHNIEGATRLSDRDGAGGLAADRAVGIVENPAAWNGVRFDCSTPRTLDLTTRNVSPRTRHRVAISWTTDPSFSDYANTPSADIDLQVVDPNGVVVATSASWDNTSEIVEFDSWWGGTYTVQAVNFRCDKPTYLGWAWDTSRI